VYAQDDWRATKKLTLAWACLASPSPFISENNNWARSIQQRPDSSFPTTGPRRKELLNSITPGPGVQSRAPCAPIETASQLGLGNGLARVYRKNFQPRIRALPTGRSITTRL